MAIENSVKNSKVLEERKKFPFSNAKGVIVKVGTKDRGYRGPKTQVNNEPISMTNTSRYLG